MIKRVRTAATALALSFTLAMSPTVPAGRSPSSDPVDAQAVSAATAKEVEGEGVVLLKNEGSLLPLQGSERRVNVFGSASVNCFYGGGGSAAIKSDNLLTFYRALEDNGIEYNEDLFKLYGRYDKLHSVNWSDLCNSTDLMMLLMKILFGTMSRNEMPVEKISEKALAKAKEFSDTAIIFVGRSGSEMFDLQKDNLRLTDDERAMVEFAANNFKNCIVVLNVCNTPELGWLEEFDSIKSVLYIGAPGQMGFDSVAKILNGEINPSGRLADTIAYRVDDHPSTANFGNFSYESGENFVEYCEGIYVGYRYFETFAPEKVQFPFGYGLSYTDFSWSLKSFEAHEDNINLEVEVKNTGARAGKDVVQVYCDAPYSGEIETSATVLGGYAKTRLLESGESQTLSISFPTRDMASYDYLNEQAWVLQEGEYNIRLASNVRRTVETRSFFVPHKRVFDSDSATGSQIQNLFDAAAQGLSFLSRSDPEGTYPTPPSDFTAPEAVATVDERPEPTSGDAPVTGAVYEQGVITLRDVYADESLWDKFLDQFTVSEMIELIGNCAYKTPGIEKYGIPATADNDGTANIKGSGGFLARNQGVAYPMETVVAQTCNDELVERMGAAIGDEAAAFGVSYWYAPAANTHRNPLGGRNFEYYSEDPLLAGKISAAITRGAQSKNLIVFIKHFALNDQETNRMGVFTWCNEQAIREIYCRPFEIAVKQGAAKGVMSAFNRLGAEWCGASRALLISLLRDEWGFDGVIITDQYINLSGKGYMDPVLAVYARNDQLLCMAWNLRKLVLAREMRNAYRDDPVGFGTALRDCTRDICKTKMRTNAFLDTL